MKVRLHDKMISLMDRDLLGVGGEANVYRHDDLALKIFHPLSELTAALGATEATRRRQGAIEKLRHFPSDLPREVVAPTAPIYDPSADHVLGYAMPLVQGAQPFGRLAIRRWRQGAVSNAEVTGLFAILADLLLALHQRGVIVGDLNDHNLLFSGQRLWLIDADSMQFGSWCCPVAHERYLDPQLYGCDLGLRAHFSPATDWYAFAVLFFSCLLYTHPFGGVHPDFPTLTRRAEAAVSVLQPSVVYPRSAEPLSILSDELGAWFSEVFDKGKRSAPAKSLLRTTWRHCSCGMEHATPRCPNCAVRTQKRSQRLHDCTTVGRFEARVVARTAGRFLAAAAGSRIYYLEFRDGALWREDGQLAARLTPQLGMRFAVSSRESWIAHRGQLLGVANGTVVTRLGCARFDEEPMFALARDGRALTLADGYLSSTLAPTRIATVVEGQTWFAAGSTQGLLFYRVGRMEFSFLFRVDRPGLTPIELPPIAGRLRFCNATFEGSQVLFERVCERSGREVHELMIIRNERVVATISSDALAAGGVSPFSGKLLRGDLILCAADDGLSRLHVDETGSTIEVGQPIRVNDLVDAHSALLPASGGGVVVMRPKSIVLLNELGH